MTRDPIVEEIMAIREQIAHENHDNLDTIFATLRRLESDSERRHLTLEPRRIESERIANS